MSNKSPLPDPLQRKPGLLVGAWRERVIQRLNQKRAAWANPMNPEADMVATTAAIDEILRLALAFADFAPGVTVDGDDESPTGETSVTIGGDLVIYRRYDSLTRAYLWAGFDIPPPGDRKYARRFSGTRGVLECVIGRLLLEADPQSSAQVVEVLRDFADGPLGVDYDFLRSCVQASTSTPTPDAEMVTACEVDNDEPF